MQYPVLHNRWKFIGPILFTLRSTMSLFSIILWAVAMFGLHRIAFYQYVPNFWIFAAMVTILFLTVAVIQHSFITPVEFAFASRQAYIHDNPFKDDIKHILELLEQRR